MSKGFAHVSLVGSEEWADICGYEGLYQVSNSGRVRSLPRATTRGVVLKQKTIWSGYKSVSLCRENVKRSMSVHRLVAEAFVPNPAGKPQVNHLNGDRGDNRVTNIEWATQSENLLHSFRVLGRAPSRKNIYLPIFGRRLFSEEQIRAIRLDPRPSTHIARELCVSKTAVRDIRIRKNYREVA